MEREHHQQQRREGAEQVAGLARKPICTQPELDRPTINAVASTAKA
jgi:hypothetical protein